jgi:hypothetical protein
MPRLLARLIVAIAAALGVWLVASPARAASPAPLCDPRGAIMFAPPPQLQPPSLTLDVPEAGPTCVERMLSDAGFEQGSLPIPTSAPEPALAVPVPEPPPAAPCEVLVSDPPRDETRPGVRARVDRPPRR